MARTIERLVWWFLASLWLLLLGVQFLDRGSRAVAEGPLELPMADRLYAAAQVPGLPPRVASRLLTLAVDLSGSPTDGDRFCRGMSLLALGRAQEAQAAWASLESAPLQRLAQAWVEADAPSPRPDWEAVRAQLGDGYLLLTLRERWDGATPAELQAMAHDNLARLAGLGLLLAFNLVGLGVCLWLGPLRRAGPVLPDGIPLPSMLRAFVAWQLLAALGVPWLLLGLTDPVTRVVLGQMLLYLAGFAWLAGRLDRSLWRLDWRDLGRGLVTFWYCLPLVLLAQVVLSLVLGQPGQSANPILGVLERSSTAQFVVLSMVVGLIGPAFEECLFRGGLFLSLGSRLGWRRGLQISSLVFAVVHADPYQIPSLLILGLGFGEAVRRSGRLAPAIVAHCLWNLQTLGVLYLMR